MNRDEAIRLLQSRSANERLQAARYFQLQGSSADAQMLRNRYSVERDAWVRRSLERALDRSKPEVAAGEGERDFSELDQLASEIRAQSVEETTGRLVHEVRAVVGDVRVRARTEIAAFDESTTKRALDRLSQLLAAIEGLSHAASSPSFQEFDLAEYLRDVVRSHGVEGVVIELTGPDPMPVVSDRALLDMILSNAIRNAVESVQIADRSDPVVVTWDRTDREYWVAVLDLGTGFTSAPSSLFEPGITSKSGHLGMGLATAEQAAGSLGGRIEILNREGGGVRFEFRWPIPLEGIS